MNKPVPLIAIEIVEAQNPCTPEDLYRDRATLQGQFRIGIGKGAIVRSFTSAEFCIKETHEVVAVNRQLVLEDAIQFAVDGLLGELSKLETPHSPHCNCPKCLEKPKP